MKGQSLILTAAAIALAASFAPAASAADEPGPGGATISARESVFRAALREAMGPGADLTVSARTTASGVWTIISLDHGVPPTKSAPAVWVRYLQGDATGVKIRQWAIAEGCPAFAAVLTSAATLRTPAIHIAGGDPVLPPNAPKAPDLVKDAVYDVWSSSLRYGGIPDPVEGQIHFTGYVNSPPDRWMDSALTRLEPCWRPMGGDGGLPPTPAVR